MRLDKSRVFRSLDILYDNSVYLSTIVQSTFYEVIIISSVITRDLSAADANIVISVFISYYYVCTISPSIVFIVNNFFFVNLNSMWIVG